MRSNYHYSSSKTCTFIYVRDVAKNPDLLLLLLLIAFQYFRIVMN